MTEIKELTDIELADRVKSSGSEDCLLELTNRHTPLCFDIFSQFSKCRNSGDLHREISDDVHILVFESCLSYDSSRSMKFSTWLGQNVKYKCLNHVYKKQANIDYVGLANNIHQPVNFSDLDDNQTMHEIEYDDLAEIVKECLSEMKDKRVLPVFTDKYLSGKNPSLRKLAAKYNCSYQTIFNILKSGKKEVRKRLTKKEYSCNT